MAAQVKYQDLCRQELQRLLESQILRYSDNMRRLLEYLGEKALEGSNELKEYTIGVEAFRKPADYDPQQDATVRVLISKLRHKLEEYYATEGATSAVRIELPRGHYELKFRPQNNLLSASSDVQSKSRIRRWQWAAIGLGAAALVQLVVLMILHWPTDSAPSAQLQAKADAEWSPELEMIWRPFMESPHPVLVSLGTPMFIHFSGSFFRGAGVNSWQSALDSEQVRLLQKELKSDFAVPSYSYTGVGEATGAFLLGRLLGGRKMDLHLMRSNAVNWDDLRTNNLVFLGSPKFDPILKDIPSPEGFRIERDAIRNLSPRPGEHASYDALWSGDHMQLLEDHALIYRLPGQYGHTEIMILSSVYTETIWAAAYYVTKPTYARELVEKVRMPSGAWPHAYQIVIHVDFKQQVPWKISYVIHRALENPWKPDR